jgi:small subunit ribosomal protein S6
VREYETTLIVQPEISDEGIETLRDRLDGVLEKGGALRLLYDDLGKRRMAYEIQNFQKGRYVMLQFLDEGGIISDLERALRLEDSVIRFMIVQVNDLVEDVPARQALAVEQERIRAQKAAERAAREAEEAVRQEVEEAARHEAEEAARKQAEADAAAHVAAAGDAETGETESENGETSEEPAEAGSSEAPASDASEAGEPQAEAAPAEDKKEAAS